MTTPLKPLDQTRGDVSRDYATNGFSIGALEHMLGDCDGQPDWRSRSDICNAYYDGKQLTWTQRAQCSQEGLDERVTNLIRPVVNSVLGQEAKTRTDVSVVADDDSYADVAEVFAAKMKEAERETNAHMAVSNAYASMVKGGIGWVHVTRNSDPLDYPYLVEDVHRNEIWWDWHGQKGNSLLAGCRWLVRKRWIDLDEITAAMPDKKAVLERSWSGWDDLTADGYFLNEPSTSTVTEMYDGFRQARDFRVSRNEWVDAARRQIKLYEVWYRVPAQVVVLHTGPGKKVEYDASNPRHVEAVARGLVRVSKAVTSQVRMSLYAGPHRLLDKGTKKRHFPYIPFFAFRDDGDRSPYGLVEGMISPQDEYNERRLRIQWMLKAKQVSIDNDALDPLYNDIADVADGVMRPDFVAVLNSNRKFENAVKVKNDLQLQPEQFTVMADSKQLIQDTAGRYASQLGNAQVQSGIANNLLIEQGEQAMGEMNDNYAFARRMTFETLMDEVASDYLEPNIQVPLGQGRARRVVVLNTWDPQTQAPVNMVADADVRTAMADVPSTPAFRAQQQQQLATIIQALGNNPKATAILAPAYLETSNLTNRQQMADDLRKVEGLPVSGDRAGAEQLERQQQQANQQAQQLQAAGAQANVAGLAAKAKLANAQADEITQRVQAGAAHAAVEKDLATSAKDFTQAELNQAKAGAQPEELIAEALAEALA